MKKIKYSICLTITASFIFSGCSPLRPNSADIDFKRPKFEVREPVRVQKPKKGSLYTTSGPSLFADKKDLQIGDIIQVEIDETLISTSKNTKDTTKTTNTGLGAGTFANLGTSGTVSKYTNKLNNAVGVSFNAGSDNSFSGEVEQKFNEAFSTTISVIIEETFQNGNYYIVGNKEILVDGEKQEIILSGIIRPFDITPENSVDSSQIANLKIKFVKNGEDAENLRKGWGSSIIEKLWPF